MKKRFPILIIGYLRFERIKVCIDKLVSFGISDIYLAVDRAKNDQDFEKQKEMCIELEAKYQSGDIKLHIWHRSTNLGVAVSVITAVDWFFLHNNSGIILEDDIEFEEDFISFCEQAWDKYEKMDNIWMVSGSNFMKDTDGLDVKFLNYPMIWGWCSSSEKWERIRKIYDHKLSIKIKDWLIPKHTYFLVGAIRANSQLVDTWDIQIANEMLKVGAFSVLPPVNLVCNKGFDDKAIHTIEEVFPLDLKVNKLELSKTGFISIDRAQAIKANHFYEQEVFRISNHHWISLFRVAFRNLLFRRSKYSLKSKLTEVELPGG
jgi:hypothetical protein